MNKSIVVSNSFCGSKCRDTVQVKTHAQVLLKRFDEGEDIFEEFDRYNAHLGPPSLRTRHQLPQWPVFPRHDEMDVAISLLILRRGNIAN